MWSFWRKVGVKITKVSMSIEEKYSYVNTEYHEKLTLASCAYATVGHEIRSFLELLATSRFAEVVRYTTAVHEVSPWSRESLQGLRGTPT